MEQEREKDIKHSRYSSIWDIPAKDLPNKADELWPSGCESEVAISNRPKLKKRIHEVTAA